MYIILFRENSTMHCWEYFWIAIYFRQRIFYVESSWRKDIRQKKKKKKSLKLVILLQRATYRFRIYKKHNKLLHSRDNSKRQKEHKHSKCRAYKSPSKAWHRSRKMEAHYKTQGGGPRKKHTRWLVNPWRQGMDSLFKRPFPCDSHSLSCLCDAIRDLFYVHCSGL